MPAQTWKESTQGQDPRSPESADVGLFAVMFNEHARHVFDYCKSMLTDQAEAAMATEATLITAYSLFRSLRDHNRLRPWLFALARNECTSANPGRAQLAAFPELSGRSDAPDPRHRPQAGSLVEPDTDELRSAGVGGPARMNWMNELALGIGSLVQDPQREVAVLVYRHRISPTELPAVLGIPARQAETLLAATSRASDDAVDAAHRAALAAPLAALPPDVWRRTTRVAFEPKYRQCRDAVAECAGQLGFDGFPADAAASHAKARARLRLLAVVMAPVVAVAAAILYFVLSPASPGGAGPARATLSGGGGGTNLGSSSHGGPAPSSHVSIKASPSNSAHVILPVAPAPTGPAASKSAKPKPKPSPTPTLTTESSAPPTTTPRPRRRPRRHRTRRHRTRRHRPRQLVPDGYQAAAKTARRPGR